MPTISEITIKTRLDPSGVKRGRDQASAELKGLKEEGRRFVTDFKAMLSAPMTGLRIDPTGVKQGAKEVKQASQEASDAVRRNAKETTEDVKRQYAGMFRDIGGGMKSLGQSMTMMVSLPLLGVMGSSLKIAGDFEQSMNVLRVQSKATAKEMDDLRRQARALGADLTLPAISSDDAARSMLEMSKAGLTVKDIMGGVRGSLELSAAAGIDAAQSSKIMSGALKAFRLEGSQASMVADLLAGAANNALGEITDMADGFQMSSAVWQMTKQDIQSLATTMAIMANQGIQGSDAGTSLKQMMLSLVGPSDKATQVMKHYGLAVYDAKGQVLGIRELIGQFSDKLGHLSEQQRNAALSIIFGSDAVRAANVVLMQGTDAYDAMRKKVTESGAAAEIAKAKNEGLKGAIDALKSSVETLLEGAGARYIKDVASWVRGTSEWAENLRNLNPEVVDLGVKIGVAAVVAGPFLIFMGSTIKACKELLALSVALDVFFAKQGANAALAATEMNTAAVAGAGLKGQLASLGSKVWPIAVAITATMVMKGFADDFMGQLKKQQGDDTDAFHRAGKEIQQMVGDTFAKFLGQFKGDVAKATKATQDALQPGPGNDWHGAGRNDVADIVRDIMRRGGPGAGTSSESIFGPKITAKLGGDPRNVGPARPGGDGFDLNQFLKDQKKGSRSGAFIQEAFQGAGIGNVIPGMTAEILKIARTWGVAEKAMAEYHAEQAKTLDPRGDVADYFKITLGQFKAIEQLLPDVAASMREAFDSSKGRGATQARVAAMKELQKEAGDVLSQQQEHVALMGEESESVRMLWQIEHGRFADLDGLAQKALLDGARAIDQRKEEIETERAWQARQAQMRHGPLVGYMIGSAYAIGKEALTQQALKYKDYMKDLTLQMNLLGSGSARARLEMELMAQGMNAADAKKAAGFKLYLDEMNQAIEDHQERVRRVTDSVMSVIDQTLRQGFRLTFGSIIDSFADMVREMAREWARSQIYSWVSKIIGGAMSGAGGGTGDTGDMLLNQGGAGGQVMAMAQQAGGGPSPVSPAAIAGQSMRVDFRSGEMAGAPVINIDAGGPMTTIGGDISEHNSAPWFHAGDRSAVSHTLAGDHMTRSQESTTVNGGGGRPIAVQVIVNATDVNSFLRRQDQVQAAMYQAAQQALARDGQ